MAFTVELADWLTGEGRGMLAWRDLVLDRTLNGGMTCALHVDNTTQAAAYARLGTATVRVWQDGTLRFHGRVREPIAATPGTVALTAGSPYTLLDRRVTPNDPVYVGVDQGAIIENRLAAQNGRNVGGTGLVMAAYSASVSRDRTYDRGKSEQELIAELAAVENGVFFLEVPVRDLAHPTRLAELHLRYPDPGTDRPGVRFEYGEGTLGNLAGYTLTQLMPVNGVFVSGAGDPVPIAELEVKASQDVYGCFDAWYSEPDVVELATLTEKANARLRLDPITLADVELVAGGPTVHGPGVPALWSDYDLGDTVYVTVHDETTVVDALALMVTQTRLTVSADDDSERVELTLQPPGEDISL